MKQHIQVKQLSELSEKGKEKLFNWCYKKNYLVWDEESLVGINSTTGWKLPLLSIGQMIEFLEEECPATYWIDGLGTGDAFQVGLGCCHDDAEFETKIESELCDALWEAVKEILETT